MMLGRPRGRLTEQVIFFLPSLFGDDEDSDLGMRGGTKLALELSIKTGSGGQKVARRHSASSGPSFPSSLKETHACLGVCVW